MKEESVKKKIERVLENFYRKSIKDPEFEYSVQKIEIEKSNSRLCVKIEISTNNRPLFMGQFLGMPLNGIDGLFVRYLKGFLEGMLSSLYNLPTRIHFDIFQKNDREITMRDILKVFDIKEAMEKGIFLEDSEITLLAKKYNLQFVAIIGADITGPVPGFIYILEDILEDFLPKNVLDLFCGTGSLSKVILKHHPCSATLVDKYLLEFARINLSAYRKNVRFIEKDVFDFHADKSFDLVIADPFNNLALPFVRKSIPSLSNLCDLLVMSITNSEDRYWCQKVEEELKKHFSNVETTSNKGIEFAICSNRT